MSRIIIPNDPSLSCKARNSEIERYLNINNRAISSTKYDRQTSSPLSLPHPISLLKNTRAASSSARISKTRMEFHRPLSPTYRKRIIPGACSSVIAYASPHFVHFSFLFAGNKMAEGCSKWRPCAKRETFSAAVKMTDRTESRRGRENK